MPEARCCWVTYLEIKSAKMQYLTLKSLLFFTKQQSLLSLHGFFNQKSPENPKEFVKKRIEIQYFWKIHS